MTMPRPTLPDNAKVWVIGQPVPVGTKGVPPHMQSVKGYGDGDAVVCGECGESCGEWCEHCGPERVERLEDLPEGMTVSLRDLEGWVGRRVWAIRAERVGTSWKVREVLFCD